MCSFDENSNEINSPLIPPVYEFINKDANKVDDDGEWIVENGVSILVTPSQSWIENNQPVLQEVIQEPTLQERLESMEMALLAMMEGGV